LGLGTGHLVLGTGYLPAGQLLTVGVDLGVLDRIGVDLGVLDRIGVDLVVLDRIGGFEVNTNLILKTNL